MQQLNLADAPRYDPSLTPAKRAETRKAVAVLKEAMQRTGAWMTLDYVARLLGCSQSAAGARIRDLRKKQYGGHTIERKLVGPNVFAWRLRP